MRSAERTLELALIGLAAAIVVGGCVPTQRIAARARLVEARIRDSEATTRVMRRNPNVRVLSTQVVETAKGTAIAVKLLNRAGVSSTDLPISVIAAHGKAPLDYLNDAPGLDYFQSHVPVIAARGSVTWVLTMSGGIRHDVHISAVVGAAAQPRPDLGGLPQIEVTSQELGHPARDHALALTIRNRSDIPQYDLQVYAVGRRAERVVSAGRAAVAHLGSDGTTRVRLPLTGDPKGASLDVFALPTILN